MSDQFVAEIRIFAFNFAPTGWALCAGQLLPISQNTALFSLLGTFYGGDGKSTFALPDLQGTAPLSQGQSSASGTQYFIGEQSGTPQVTLIQTEIPIHNHAFFASNDTNNLTTDANNTQLAQGIAGDKQNSFTASIYSPNAPQTAMSFQSLATSGGSLPHNNMMPYLALNPCIALQGIFPARP